jgi:hypothetical protein
MKLVSFDPHALKVALVDRERTREAMLRNVMIGLNLFAATSIALSGAIAEAKSSNPNASFTFERPIPKWQRTVVDDQVLRCDKDQCGGQIERFPSSQMRACRTLRRRFGSVVAVRVGSVAWDRSKIDISNASR